MILIIKIKQKSKNESATQLKRNPYSIPVSDTAPDGEKHRERERGGTVMNKKSVFTVE